MIQKSSASFQRFTCGEVRSIAGGYRPRPSGVFERPSPPWQSAQDWRYKSIPFFAAALFTVKAFLRSLASSGITTSFAIFARPDSTLEGRPSAEHAAQTNSITTAPSAAGQTRFWLTNLFTGGPRRLLRRLRFLNACCGSGFILFALPRLARETGTARPKLSGADCAERCPEISPGSDFFQKNMQ